MGDFFRAFVAAFVIVGIVALIVIALVALDLDGSRKKPGGKRGFDRGVELVLPQTRSVV